MNTDLFERESISKAYLKLSLPVVFSGVLTLVYNLVDMFFIAQTGNTNLVAGISLCAPIFTLLIAMGDVLGLGGSSVISRLIGNKQEDDARRLSVFCLYGAILLGLFIACILLIAQDPILSLLGVTSKTYTYAQSYYFIISIGSPFVILSLAPTNLLRTEGNANAAMIGSVTGSIVNIILDPVFIFGLNMGAAGAALATIIGNVIADIWYVYFITHKSIVISFDLKGFYIKLNELLQILKIGIPSSVTNIMQSLGVILLNLYLLPYGVDKVAAMGIVSRITMVVIMVMVGFSFGGQPLYGYLYGAKMKQRLLDVIHYAYRLIISLSILLSIVLAFAAPLLIQIFMRDPNIINAGTPSLRIVLIGMPFIGISMVSTCIFQATGKALGALILSTARQGFVYIVVLKILSSLFGYYGVVASQPSSDFITACIALLLMRSLLKEIHTFPNTIDHTNETITA